MRLPLIPGAKGLLRTCLLLAGLLSLACGGERPPTPPNVIVIVVDTLRADHLSHYGYTRETSPGLAEFAARATRFTRAYSTSSWTQPSIASLFTGLLPASHNVVVRGAVVSAELETVAERLAQSGWQTAAFSGNMLVGKLTGYDQGFGHFIAHEGNTLAYPDLSQIHATAERWLDDRADSPEPFFLYLQPMNCHGPYNVPAERQTDLLGYEPSREFEYRGEIMQSVVTGADLSAREQVTPELLQSLTDQYDTAIRYSLDTVGQLLQSLHSRELYDDSLIILTSDHGEELFDRGGFSHGYSLYEEVVRVPLWVKLPGQTRSVVVEHPVSLVDIYPTILDVLSLEIPAELHGISLLPLLDSDPATTPSSFRPILFETRWRDRAVAAAIRMGPYKMIDLRSNYEGRGNLQMLFDLENDPDELEDIAALHPEIVEPMVIELLRVLTAGENPNEVETVDLDPKALEALGYLD